MGGQLMKEGALPKAVGTLHHQEWLPLIETALYPVQKIAPPIEMGGFNNWPIYHVRVGERDPFAQDALPL
jgi:hypothetical protein